jgi:hypothetical protein
MPGYARARIGAKRPHVWLFEKELSNIAKFLHKIKTYFWHFPIPGPILVLPFPNDYLFQNVIVASSCTDWCIRDGLWMDCSCHCQTCFESDLHFCLVPRFSAERFWQSTQKSIFKIFLRSLSFSFLCPQSQFPFRPLPLHDLTRLQSFLTDVGESKTKELAPNELVPSSLHNHPDFHSISMGWSWLRPGETEIWHGHCLICAMMPGERRGELRLRCDLCQISVSAKHQPNQL